jgi:hypothetical protein
MPGRDVLTTLAVAIALFALTPLIFFYLLMTPLRRAQMTPLGRAIERGEDLKNRTIRQVRRRRAQLGVIVRSPAPPQATVSRPVKPVASIARAFDGERIGA